MSGSRHSNGIVIKFKTPEQEAMIRYAYTAHGLFINDLFDEFCSDFLAPKLRELDKEKSND
jgi:hypothetical protein